MLFNTLREGHARKVPLAKSPAKNVGAVEFTRCWDYVLGGVRRWSSASMRL
jgi:hypothetical protein